MVTDYEQDPGYQFRLREGQKTLDRGAAAQGRWDSGRSMKDSQRFVQDQASQEFGNSWNRWNTNQTNKFNRMASVAGVGQTAAAANQAAGSNYGNQAAANITGIGNARAAGQVGQANAWSNAIGQGLSMYSQNELMNRLLKA